MLAHTVNTSYTLALFKHTHVQYSSLMVGRKKLRITALKVKKNLASHGVNGAMVLCLGLG